MKFKVGDKVKIFKTITDSFSKGDSIGKTCEIIGIDGWNISFPYKLSIDNGYNYAEDELELVETKKYILCHYDKHNVISIGTFDEINMFLSKYGESYKDYIVVELGKELPIMKSIKYYVEEN